MTFPRAISRCLVFAAALHLTAQAALARAPVEGVLKTRFAAEVSPTNAHPEYPRPQMVRPDWQSLNGLWDYAITSSGTNSPAQYDGEILVPFPVESALSGVGRRFWETNTLWYRRTFAVPESWMRRRVLLHFGAVDWESRVFVNGKPVAQHKGGYDPFSVDITPFLSDTNRQELVVAVHDPTEGQQPRGKQSLNPEGIFYTPSSGIWQSVWLEPVPLSRIDGLELTPDLASRTLRIKVLSNRIATTFRVEVAAMQGDKVVARAAGPPNAILELPIEGARAWSPEDPFLYGLEVTLSSNDGPVDKVSSYFALRDIEVRRTGSFPEIFLNEKSLLQVGVLDQGFWPDGLHTAPCDRAWQEELSMLKRMGFNTVRKHVKVEPQRWYYWCDRLGLLVWQDMPSGNNLTPEARRQFETEFERMVRTLYNHPSIVMWVIFNEGWGQYDTERLVRLARSLDSSRLINGASGWIDRRVGDVVDVHSYPGPEAPPVEASRAAVLGEFGGLGLPLEGHLWSTRTWGYGVAETREQLTERYLDLMRRMHGLRSAGLLSAVIYTQLSDVETEVNGLVTYDREVIKIDPEVVHKASVEYADTPERVLSPFGGGNAQWRYTFEPPGPRWRLPDFNMRSWKRGQAGFGAPGAVTAWETPRIWLRRVFVAPEVRTGVPAFRIKHDANAEIFINGIPAANLEGASDGYITVPVAPGAAEALRDGPNLLTVHATSNSTNRFIDVGLVLLPGP